MPKPVQVLILDDDREVLLSMERLFSDEPYAVIVTAHPFEALGIMAREQIKVVIADQRMPMVSGSDFLKEVRINFPNIVRILFTGHADMRAAEAAVNQGQVFAFFSKPFTPEALISAVHRGIEVYDAAALDQGSLKALREKREELRGVLADIKQDVSDLRGGGAGQLTAEQSGLAARIAERVEKIAGLLG